MVEMGGKWVVRYVVPGVTLGFGVIRGLWVLTLRDDRARGVSLIFIMYGTKQQRAANCLLLFFSSFP